jgi:rhodanese-related sulfurtransferase
MVANQQEVSRMGPSAKTSIPASINTATAAELRSENARILDVRTPAEFESVHIPGSYNVPLDLLSEHREELSKTVDGPVILVCASGMRAKQADNTLRDAGFSQLTVLEGGINAWQQNGYEVVRGQQKWSLERQVRGVAGTLVVLGTLGGLLVWQPLALLALFVGAGLTFAALTNTCGMAMLLARLPYNRGASCDIREVMDQLAVDQSR